MDSQQDKLFYELFIATLGMFSVGTSDQRIGSPQIQSQFEQVLEARNQCEQIFTKTGLRRSA